MAATIEQVSEENDREAPAMNSSLEAIRRVIAAFERSDWAEIDVRFGDVRLHLATGPTASAASAPTPPPPAPSPNRPAEKDAADPAPSGTPALPPDAHVVVAPSPGIFWRAPEPGAPPFADVGDVIDPSTTMCIIEVMKLMSHIKAGVGGVVVAVYGENGSAVQKGDPLFGIAPNDTVTPP